MEKKVIAEEIYHLLEVINEQTAVLKSYPSYIPQIELDIVINNIRNLYERFYELQKLNSLEAPVSKFIESLTETTELLEILPEEQIKVETQIKNEPEIIISEPESHVQEIMETPVVLHVEEKPELKVIAEEKPELFSEEPVAPAIAAVHENHVIEKTSDSHEVLEQIMLETEISTETVEKKSKHKKASPDLFSATVTLADKYKDENKSLNERFSSGEKKEKSISDKMQEKPIKDLKAAIGINDKFKFINELFDGNLQAYNETIASLNNFLSFGEAGPVLDQLKEEYNWTNDNESFVKLSDMVIRRYL